MLQDVPNTMAHAPIARSEGFPEGFAGPRALFYSSSSCRLMRVSKNSKFSCQLSAECTVHVPMSNRYPSPDHDEQDGPPLRIGSRSPPRFTAFSKAVNASVTTASLIASRQALSASASFCVTSRENGSFSKSGPSTCCCLCKAGPTGDRIVRT
jgi:hypothetical protein